jgi:hypothetical protein
MSDYTNTNLWCRCFIGDTTKGREQNQFERLQNAYLTFRSRAASIAGEIARNLPDYTVHDVTHLDALWEMADLIAGPEYFLTPIEGFVLGGCFLIHDLGNGLAAYPKGLDELRKEQLWLDTVSTLLRRHLGRVPTPDELDNPSKEVEEEAIGQVLRELHAKQAERLALISWKDRESDEEYHLIEDVDLRRTYGRIIGKIAHSHWWNVDRLSKEFTASLNPPPGFPREWTLNPLKIACLLRVADASHLDSRRAPGFLRALRRPSNISRQHWIFQENLQQPRLEGDRLVYTSGHIFSIEEAPSWWLCFDTLRMVDSELRQVDALLADSGCDRFAAHGVAGVEEPDRLIRWIPTDNWSPVDTKIRVGNVARLVSNLGGQHLYGLSYAVPLREMIQNASDAVRARRVVDKRGPNYGSVTIRLGEDSDGYWIEVEDDGVGMSTSILTGPFLDFGSSLWGSPLMHKEFPGLAATGFESTGRFGIGFFSVFMLGDRVRVTTRPYRTGLEDTQVLEFYDGLDARPILRTAEEKEYIRDGGTIIRVWLEDDPLSSNSIFFSYDENEPQTWEELCTWLCPSLDVTLYLEKGSEDRKVIIKSRDWITIDSKDFLRRIWRPRNIFRGHNPLASEEESDPLRDQVVTTNFEALAENLRLIKDSSGNVVGRACVYAAYDHRLTDYQTGLVSVGGLRSCGLEGIAGLFIGNPTRAARDNAVPVITNDVLAGWASEQSSLAENVENDPRRLMQYASVIRRCGGRVGGLPIAQNSHGWVTFKDIVDWSGALDEVLLLESNWIQRGNKHYRQPIELNGDVLASTLYPRSLMSDDDDMYFEEWPEVEVGEHSDFYTAYDFTSLKGAIIEALASAWSVDVNEVLKASNYLERKSRFVREVGKYSEKPFLVEVDIIKKPS